MQYVEFRQKPAWATAGLLRDVQGEVLAQIHILVTPPIHRNFYSDAHITLQLKGRPDVHMYYQVNNDRLVPRDPRGRGWVGFEGFQGETEDELLKIVRHTRGPVPKAPQTSINMNDFPVLSR